jgi:hypothetical protein
MLLEKYGTNNTIKYFSIMFKKLYDSLSGGENTITFDLNGDDFSMKNFTVQFLKSNSDHGKFLPKNKTIVDNTTKTIHNCDFIISFSNEDNIIELSSHELCHCYEYINLNCKIDKYTKEISDSVKTMSFKLINSVRDIEEFIEKDDIFSKFLYIIKNTTNTEINARISQLYLFLLEFEPNIELLKEKLKLSKSYKIYEDVKDFINNESNEIENIDNIINITNKLNENLRNYEVNKKNGYDFIKRIMNNEQLKTYYNHWFDLFRKKNEEYLQKMYKVIDRVIDKDNIKFREEILDENLKWVYDADREYDKYAKEYHMNKKSYVFDYKEFEKFIIHKKINDKINRIIIE